MSTTIFSNKTIATYSDYKAYAVSNKGAYGMLTTSEKATERDPRSMQKAAPYLLSTIVAIKVQENAPRSPERNKYDLLR